MVDHSVADSSRPRSLLQLRPLLRAAAVGLAVLFVLRIAYFLFHDAADGVTEHVRYRIFEEVTGGALAVIPVAGLIWLALRVPLVRDGWRRAVPVYVFAFIFLSLVHTFAMIVVRVALAPRFGLTDYTFSVGAARYAYEMANDVIPGVALLALLALTESVLAQRERERRAAGLERSLLRAELGNLRLQLQPHFLFNALNTIASTMYEDVDSADRQVTQLAELLRFSLRTAHTHEVPVRDELQLLAHYVGLLRARFGERLTVTVDAPDDVNDLLVPSMVLQPLVENAVRHGGVSRRGRGEVSVTLRRADKPRRGMLMLRVQDDGPPVVSPMGEAAGGTGLFATAQRLTLLYGDAQTLDAGPLAGGGFAVTLSIPARQ